MPENKGFYPKYIVERADGLAINGPTWTLELSKDPFALPSLQAYRDAAAADGGYPLLVADLDNLLLRVREGGA